jgi:hypothetical protein
MTKLRVLMSLSSRRMRVPPSCGVDETTGGFSAGAGSRRSDGAQAAQSATVRLASNSGRT